MAKSDQKSTRNIILLFGMVLLFFCHGKLLAQNTSVLDSILSFKSRNRIVYDALNDIGKLIGYEFSYNSDLIPANTKVKINETQVKLTDLLNTLLCDSTLDYKVVDQQIVIVKKNPLTYLMFLQSGIETVNYISIYGKIKDHDTKEDLSFANISVNGKSIGTISNEFGEFNINISNDLLFDTLVFSYLGYRNTYIPINQLSISDNLIFLTQDIYRLQEVVIKAFNANEILLKTINKININYYTDPYQIVAFYREIVTKEKKLMAITEAVIDVYKSPYLGLYSDQIKLLKGRKSDFYSQSDSLSLKLKGGLYASLYLDIIKNPSYFFKEDFFTYYQYAIEELIYYDNKLVYVVEFKPLGHLEVFSFEGKMYIDKESLTLVEAEYNLTQDAIERMGNELVVQRARGTNVKPVSVKYKVNYRNINGKYFLNFARGELQFKVKYKRKLFVTDFKTVFEFASNNIDTVNIERFERDEIISSQDIFLDENYEYDHRFWGEYNYISPEESLQEAIIEIQRKIERLKEN